MNNNEVKELEQHLERNNGFAKWEALKALSIINRQKAEIDILIRKNERLKDEVSELRAEVERLQNERIERIRELTRVVYDKEIAEIKSEARKELAERLCEGRVSNDPVVIAAKVELAEMESERG